ncbi:alanine racemase [uncultured Mitsuokella sp.]|uniref:alanine racemase n=1 Tax=uncultured Mitsuokella sp. TaxID=453120 RepID=UPI002670BF43|nr:alanine racemase [uncultured Mitsuokella sp.]
MPNRAAWAEIDLKALRHNYGEIKKNIKNGAKLCAVVKADAYGHGALAVARVAVEAGASYLAVATLGEAIELREAGFTTPILLLGLVLPDEARDIVDYDVTQVICELPLAEAISKEAVRQNKTAKVHLKVETGMGRIGIRPEEIGALAAAVKKLPNIEIEGMFSHFAMADCKDKTYTKGQLEKFEQALAEVKKAGVDLKLRHIAESAAILEIPEAHYDMVRAGVIQYGMWPSEEVTHPIDLKPVMKLCAKVVFLKTVHKGESIGYGRQFIAERESRIATLPIGYADGYIRAYSNGGSVSFGGRRAPIAGRVCMDQVMVDVTDLPDIKEGDTAVLFGDEDITADEAAKWLNTINYEVTCLVSPRVPRVYKG